MSYVDAIWDKENDQIQVVERVNGKRVFKSYPAEYVFYYTSPEGKFKTIFGDVVQKFSTSSYKIFQREINILSDRKIFESDTNPVFRCLHKNYKDVPEPDLHIAFIDIEVDFNPEKGFSTPEDAFNPITAISIYCNWIEELITLVCKPAGMSKEEAQKICGNFKNCFLCDTERELLESFLKFIEDADLISGWNSSGYDLPYIHNRIAELLGKDYLRMLCLWNKVPRKRHYIQFKADRVTYDLIGRVHIDYLDLYRKHNTQERASFRLDFIGEQEIGEKKIPYEGTLDSLYKNDFQKFIEYNRQDVLLIVKIDKKVQFLALANQLAHNDSVLLQTTLGSVARIDQAIINEAHRRDMLVHNRKVHHEEIEENDDEEDEEESESRAAGAYVAYPKIGLHEYVGAVDINSLYPSTIRAFNMSPETVVGQIRPTYTTEFINEKLKKMKQPSAAKAWEGVFNVLEYDIVMNQEEKELILDLESGDSIPISGKNLYEFIFGEEEKYCLSANGTIFRLDIEGVIPGLLARWYSGRKSAQKKSKDFFKMADEIDDAVKKEEYRKQGVFWDQRQYLMKIQLNSLYGAILNEGSRFYDHRIGQSVTLSGRMVARHMGAEINRIIYGKYLHDGEGSLYADTDSNYFSSYIKDLEDGKLKGVKDLKEYFIKRYNKIADEVNESFPPFMNKSFNIPKKRGEVIQASRELVGTKGLFITKKRYAVLIYDKENKRKDIGLNQNGEPILGEIKAMGLDTKRSDTPEVIQKFLEAVIQMVLNGKSEAEVIAYIFEFRENFRKIPGWEKGTPKRVNALTTYGQAMEHQEGGFNFKNQKEKKKVTIPGHVRASLNYNKIKKILNDNYSMTIMDGSKVIVCKLLQNNFGITSIAYPVDELTIPEWFRILPFDHEEMEATIIDKKIQNLIGVLGWDLKSSRVDTTFNDLFKF